MSAGANAVRERASSGSFLATGSALAPSALAAALQGTYAWLPFLCLVPLLPVLIPSGRRARPGSSRENVHRPDALLRLAIVLLVVVSVINAFRTPITDLTLLGQLSYLGVAAAVAAPFFRRFGDATRIRAAVVVSGSVVATVYLISLLPIVLTEGVHVWALTRAAASWANPNTLGLYFLIALAVPLRAIAAGESRMSTWLGAAVLTCAVAITFSRSAYIGLAAMTLILLARSGRALLLLGPPLVVLVLNLPDVVVDRIGYTSVAGTLDVSSSTRLNLWAAGWRIALDRPFTGVGIHALGGELSEYGATSQFAFVHNTYLTIVASFGFVVPLVLALALVSRLARNAQCSTSTVAPGPTATTGLKAPRRMGVPSELGLATVATLVCSLFGEPLLSPIVFIPLIAVSVVREQVR